jgi:hypothetical protein
MSRPSQFVGDYSFMSRVGQIAGNTMAQMPALKAADQEIQHDKNMAQSASEAMASVFSNMSEDDLYKLAQYKGFVTGQTRPVVTPFAESLQGSEEGKFEEWDELSATPPQIASHPRTLEGIVWSDSEEAQVEEPLDSLSMALKYLQDRYGTPITTGQRTRGRRAGTQLTHAQMMRQMEGMFSELYQAGVDLPTLLQVATHASGSLSDEDRANLHNRTRGDNYDQYVNLFKQGNFDEANKLNLAYGFEDDSSVRAAQAQGRSKAISSLFEEYNDPKSGDSLTFEDAMSRLQAIPGATEDPAALSLLDRVRFREAKKEVEAVLFEPVETNRSIMEELKDGSMTPSQALALAFQRLGERGSQYSESDVKSIIDLYAKEWSVEREIKSRMELAQTRPVGRPGGRGSEATPDDFIKNYDDVMNDLRREANSLREKHAEADGPNKKNLEQQIREIEERLQAARDLVARHGGINSLARRSVSQGDSARGLIIDAETNLVTSARAFQPDLADYRRPEDAANAFVRANAARNFREPRTEGDIVAVFDGVTEIPVLFLKDGDRMQMLSPGDNAYDRHLEAYLRRASDTLAREQVHSDKVYQQSLEQAGELQGVGPNITRVVTDAVSRVYGIGVSKAQGAITPLRYLANPPQALISDFIKRSDRRARDSEFNKVAPFLSAGMSEPTMNKPFIKDTEGRFYNIDLDMYEKMLEMNDSGNWGDIRVGNRTIDASRAQEAFPLIDGAVKRQADIIMRMIQNQ